MDVGRDRHYNDSAVSLFRLSGVSPFQGNSDAETLALVTAAEWEFDEESFDEITEEAKDFISALLTKDSRWFHTHITQCPDPIITSPHVPLNCVLLRQRICCQEALAHPWMAAFDSGEVETKNLSKEKMKKFLARQKWKVTPQLSHFVVVLFQTCDIFFVIQKAGKALLALKRMAVLSKGDGTGSPINPREGETRILLLSYQAHLNLDLQQSCGDSTFIYFLLLFPRFTPEPRGRGCAADSGPQDAGATSVHPVPGGPDSSSGIQCPSLMPPHRCTQLLILVTVLNRCINTV